MIISLLAALDRRGGIGIEGRLPWRLSADLKRFKELSMGHHLVMGRKTYQSIGRPLPGRTNLVISRQSAFLAPGCVVVSSLDQALSHARSAGEQEVFIIGGGVIFALAMPLAQRLYLTEVHTSLPADTFFPEYKRGEWVEVHTSEHPADEKNEYPSTFRIFERAGASHL